MPQTPKSNLLSDFGVGEPDATTPPIATAEQDPIASIPAIRAVLDAEVPGVVAYEADFKRPEVKLVGANLPKLYDLGLGFYKSKDGGHAIFNPAVLAPAEVEELDRLKKLPEFFRPFSDFLGGESAPSAPSAPSALPAPTPSSVQRPLAAADAKQYSVATSRPTKRPVPGSGILLQDLLVQPK